MRVPTELWVKALIRRCNAAGASALVARRGEADQGVVFLKVLLLDGTAKLFGPAVAGLPRPDGMPRLEPHLAPDGVPEAEVDAYLKRQAAFDSDLWVVEIMDRDGRSFLDE